MKSIFYLAKGNVVPGTRVFRRPPIKIFRTSDVTVCWSGSGGEEGREQVCFYLLEKFIPLLDVAPTTCMEVEMKCDGDEVSIKVLDRNVDCEVSYH